jgi:large subunit ribosomal protein L32
MALPKRRHSNTRGRLRRTHYKLPKTGFSECPQCKQAKLPHRVCGNCGYYGGRTAEVKEEA